MRVMIIGGSAGHEHALLWRMSKSPRVSELYCVTESEMAYEYAYVIEPPGKEPGSFVALAKALKADLVMCLRHGLLEAGIIDMMKLAGIRAFGETRSDLKIESGRMQFKNICVQNSIPVAMTETFYTEEEARAYAETCPLPIMIKAGFLNAGAGAMMAHTREEAREFLKTLIKQHTIEPEVVRVTFDECITGAVVSIMAATDGTHVIPLTTMKEYRHVWDGNLGMEIDGMGAISPYPGLSAEETASITNEMLVPIMNAYKRDGISYSGMLHFMVMLTRCGAKAMELNTHFGDMQTQVVLCSMENDAIDLIEHVMKGTLDELQVCFSTGYTVQLVLASGGYPGRYATGYRVDGIESAQRPGVSIFHNNLRNDGREFYTAGGRVLSICARGDNIEDAVSLAYETAERIKYKDKYMRSDIATEFVEGMEVKD